MNPITCWLELGVLTPKNTPTFSIQYRTHALSESHNTPTEGNYHNKCSRGPGRGRPHSIFTHPWRLLKEPRTCSLQSFLIWNSVTIYKKAEYSFLMSSLVTFPTNKAAHGEEGLPSSMPFKVSFNQLWISAPITTSQTVPRQPPTSNLRARRKVEDWAHFTS